MSKHTTANTLTPVIYQLGKDIGDINRRLSVIEQRVQSAQPSQPQAEAVTMPQQDVVTINNINAVLEAVETYKTFEKHNTQVQERFEKFLSRNPNDYELSEEQRQKLYHTMCQHLWQVNFTDSNSKPYELPIPPQFQGKFGYIVKTSGGSTEISFELLSETHSTYLYPDGYIPEGGGDVMFKPAYIYLVIPDLVALREPQVVAVSPLTTTAETEHSAETPAETSVTTENTGAETPENEGKLIDGVWHFEKAPLNYPKDQNYYVAGNLFYNGVPD